MGHTFGRIVNTYYTGYIHSFKGDFKASESCFLKVRDFHKDQGNFSYLYFEGSPFRNFNSGGLRFWGSDFTNSSLYACTTGGDFSNSIFINADIYNFAIIEGRFDSCSFRHSTIKYSSFDHSSMENVNFDSTTMVNVSLKGIDQSGSFIWSTINDCDFTNMNLYDTKFYDATIKFTDFSNSAFCFFTCHLGGGCSKSFSLFDMVSAFGFIRMPIVI